VPGARIKIFSKSRKLKDRTYKGVILGGGGGGGDFFSRSKEFSTMIDSIIWKIYLRIS